MIVTLAPNIVTLAAKSWKSCERTTHDLVHMYHTMSPGEAPLWTPSCKIETNPRYKPWVLRF
jgi:hypothetical protein